VLSKDKVTENNDTGFTREWCKKFVEGNKMDIIKPVSEDNLPKEVRVFWRKIVDQQHILDLESAFNEGFREFHEIDSIIFLLSREPLGVLPEEIYTAIQHKCLTAKSGSHLQTSLGTHDLRVVFFTEVL
jgi:hypothetical protein